MLLSQKEVFELIERATERIVDEIGCGVPRKLKGFDSPNMRILLTGGGSLIRGLPEFVQNNLKFEQKQQRNQFVEQ